MLEGRFVRAGTFFVVAFSVPVALGILLNDVDGGFLVGVVMGLVWAVMSQFFEPAEPLAR